MKNLMVFGISSLIFFNPVYASPCVQISPSSPGLVESTTVGNPNLQVKKNICYTAANDLQRSYDIYASNFNASNKPVVILIHGGSWKESNTQKTKMVTDDIPSVVSYLANQGFAVASINYRGVPEQKMDTIAADVRDAIVKIVADAPYNKTDGLKVFLLGASAGAHLASLAGSSGLSRLKVKGVIAYKGLYEIRGPWKGGDVDYMHAGFAALRHTTDSGLYKNESLSCCNEEGAFCNGFSVEDCNGEMVAGILTRAVGSNLWEDGNKVYDTNYSDAQTMAFIHSPIVYWGSVDIAPPPPHLFIHGTADPLVPMKQSEDAYNRLNSSGISSQECYVDFYTNKHGDVVAADHGFMPSVDEQASVNGDPLCWNAFVNFINNH